MTRYEHAGAAAPTTLTSAIAATSTTFTIGSGTGWPTGSVGPFWVTIDPGGATEERVLVATRSGNTLNVTTRGAEGTSAQAHAANTTIEHTFSATEADDASAHIANNTVHVTNSALLLTTTGTQVVTNKDLSSPSNTFPSSASNVTLSGVQTLTNKDLSSATNTFPASHLTTTGIQTVTNKDLSSATNTLAAAIPRGVLGYAQTTTAQTSLTTGPTDLTTLTVTVTVAAGRRIRVSGFDESQATSGVGPYNAFVSIYEGATELQRADASHEGTGRLYQHKPEVILTPSAGSHTYKLRFGSNAGTWTVGPATSCPAFVLVEDIGV